MSHFDNVVSPVPESIMAVNGGLHHSFPLWRAHYFFISVLLISPHTHPHVLFVSC